MSDMPIKCVMNWFLSLFVKKTSQINRSYVFSIDENMGPTWTDLLDIENTGRLM